MERVKKRGMRVFGIDFTSAPKRRKPITCAKCTLRDGRLCVEGIANLTSFEQFEQFLGSEGSWIAGIDFPFGQPRKLVENLDWPLTWSGYVEKIGSMSRQEFVKMLEMYQKGRPKGDKQHMRVIDKKANSCSPMMLHGVPVGKMFFEGAPRLLRSRASILPCQPTDSNRLVVEAYPALVAKKYIGSHSYKNDTKGKQTAEHRGARSRIVKGLRSDKLWDDYCFAIGLSAELAELSEEDATGDILDAILCAIQACWAYEHREENHGIPPDCDPLEGWIVDPAMLERAKAGIGGEGQKNE